MAAHNLKDRKHHNFPTQEPEEFLFCAFENGANAPLILLPVPCVMIKNTTQHKWGSNTRPCDSDTLPLDHGFHKPKMCFIQSDNGVL